TLTVLPSSTIVAVMKPAETPWLMLAPAIVATTAHALMSRSNGTSRRLPGAVRLVPVGTATPLARLSRPWPARTAPRRVAGRPGVPASPLGPVGPGVPACAQVITISLPLQDAPSSTTRSRPFFLL